MSASLFAEVFPGKKGFDRYGGYLAYKGTATGRFHLEIIEGRHYLVTPEGHGSISIGVTHTIGLARPEQSRRDYFKEKFGGDWDKANVELIANFRKWGYNSLGYGSHESTRQLLPYFASCDPSRTSTWRREQVEFPDVFSDAWKKEARSSIEQMVETYSGSPNLIGIYWTDIPAWDLKQATRRADKTWVDAIRALPEDAPGRMRYERFLREHGADASDEDFLVLIAREMYSYIGSITRELAPGTLIFGERYAGWVLPWRVIQEALPWIDVVSVQPIASEFPKETFERLYRETGKPVMICDHQSSFNTPEHSNVMWNTLPDVASVGRAHARYLDEGFSTPFLIGYNRCQYIDRYKEGQKILKQGLLQVDGKPYEELVDSVQKNNWRIHERFINTAAASPSKGAFDPSKFLKDYAGQMTIGCKNAWRNEESLVLGEYVERNNKLHLNHFTGVQPAHYPAWRGSWPDAMPDVVSSFTFNATGLGELVKWAVAHDQPTLHHLLVASNQYFPRWFWSAEYSPEELDQILEAYITTMVTDDNARKVDVWNVFNEMFQHSRKLGTYKEDGTGRKNSVWMRMGYEADRSGLEGDAKVNDRHPIVFRKTLEYASVASGKLEIRENEVAEINRKSDALYQLVRHLQNSGVRVDIVGFQGHLHVDRSYDWESVKQNIKRFRDLGVEVYITELDVGISGAYGWKIGDPLPDNYVERQCAYYYNMVKAAREAGVARIDVWGLSDGVKNHWQEGQKARLLDENFERRPQYEAMLRALYDTLE